MATIRLHDLRDQRHFGWNRANEPAVRAAPGDEVELAVADCFDGQLSSDPTAADVAALDLARANPLTGPVFVEGAAPGDALVLELLDVQVADVGWTTNIPGFGLLADDFPEPHVVTSSISTNSIGFGDVAELSPRPFVGTIGVAPAEEGTHSVIPPRRVGGNMDCRDVRPGARLWLPVEVEGALLSVGDAHGAQGDGEVCGTAVETGATVTIRLGIEPGAAPRTPRIELATRGSEPERGWRRLTTGIGPDLLEGAREATRRMIELLGQERGLDPVDAYALCSVAGHLRIVEVVDAPNWVVAMELEIA